MTRGIPSNIYEQSSLAGANLMAGDVDGFTASIFAPMSLSPDEIDNLKGSFTLGGSLSENPIIRTATELATSPLMWIGIALSLGPWGKLRSLKDLAGAMSEGKQYTREVMPFMRTFLSPFTALRDLWHTGWMNKGLEAMGHTVAFQSKHMEVFDTMVRETQKRLGRALTERERVLWGAYMEGMHTKAAPLATQIGLEGEVLTPRLLEAMPADLRILAAQHRTQFKEIYDTVIRNHEEEFTGELGKKGIELLQYEEHYGFRVTNKPGLAVWIHGGKGPAKAEYTAMMRGMGTTGGRARATHARTGFSVPDPKNLELIQDVFDPRAYQKILRFSERMSDDMTVLLSGTAQSLMKLQAAGAPEMEYAKLGTHVGQMLKQLRHDPALGGRMVSALRQQLEMAPHTVPDLIANLAGRVGPAKFTLDPLKYMPKYIRQMGPSYSWITLGYGKLLDDIFVSPTSKFSHEIQGWQKDMYTDNIRPALKGLMTPTEWGRRMSFDDSKIRLGEWLRSDSPVVAQIPKNLRDWMSNSLGGKGWSEDTIGGKLASLFYVSSLGMNLSPVSKNVFQNFITTANFIRPGNMAKGMATVAGRTSRMLEEMGKGVEFDKAFQNAFPEYYSQFGYEHMLRAMTRGDIAKEAEVASSVIKSAYDKVSGVMMAPFATSEKFNRLWAFYSTHHAALSEGLSSDAALNISRNLTLLTQFGGGPLGIPSGLRSWPTLARQFAQFPLRNLEWQYMGGTMGPGGKGISTGVAGRTVAGSTGLYSIFKNLVGLDVSPGLAASALPLPEYPNSPFYPFPIVPPALGLAGDIFKSGLSGDWSSLPGKVGAMLTPGGLAMRRMWRNWSPRYVDYKNPLPDGRFPLYNNKGGLIKYETPMQMTLRGLGIKPTGDAQEYETVQWLIAQRDKLRAYRSQYAEAIAEADTNKAAAIQAQFKKKYPQLGELQVKKSDVKAVTNRRLLTRAERIMKGIPSAYRPYFEEAVGLSVMGEMANAVDTTDTMGFAF